MRRNSPPSRGDQSRFLWEKNSDAALADGSDRGVIRRNGPGQLTGLDEPTRPLSLPDPASAASSDSFSCKKGGIGPPFRLPGHPLPPAGDGHGCQFFLPPLGGWGRANNFSLPPAGDGQDYLFFYSPLVYWARATIVPPRGGGGGGGGPNKSGTGHPRSAFPAEKPFAEKYGNFFIPWQSVDKTTKSKDSGCLKLDCNRSTA
jgi:hypothetical protein